MKGETPTPTRGIGDLDQHPERTSVEQGEVDHRVRATATLSAAMESGDWPVTVETLGYLAKLVDDAARWQSLAELALAA